MRSKGWDKYGGKLSSGYDIDIVITNTQQLGLDAQGLGGTRGKERDARGGGRERGRSEGHEGRQKGA